MRSTDMGVLLATQPWLASKTRPLIMVKLISKGPGCASRCANAPRKCRHSAEGEVARLAVNSPRLSCALVISGGGKPAPPAGAGCEAGPCTVVAKKAELKNAEVRLRWLAVVSKGSGAVAGASLCAWAWAALWPPSSGVAAWSAGADAA